MKTDDLDQTLRDTLSGVAPAEIHQRTDQHFQTLAAQVRQQESRPPARRRESTLAWWLWPGVSLAGAAAVAALMFSIFVSPTVSWAQVVERFRTLSYFGVTVYVAPDPAQPPEKIEIWATHDHRTRVHYRGLIFLGQGDKGVRVLRAETGEEIPLAALQGKDADEEFRKNYPALNVAFGVPESLGRMENFSLDGLLRIFSGKREDLRPVPNVEASIATDLQVFDLVTKQSSEWIRLWVLKKSELPVRIRSFNPSVGDQIEAVFDYFTEMPEEAFDPAKVQASVRHKQGHANKLYALLKDPGGRPLTPEDLFAAAGLHLPELASVGRTMEGVVWVQSHQGENQRSDGGRFDGWGKLTDNLGQEYLHVWAGQRLEGDIHAEYFIPLNYRAGYRKPASYLLTCWDREDQINPTWRSRPTTVVGSVEVKQWVESASVPKIFDGQPSLDAAEFVRHLLNEFVALEDWERFNALAATIPGAPEESELALYRDMNLARKLDLIRQHDQAVALRARLFPLVKDTVKKKSASGEELGVIEGHLCDLVRAGQREAARPLANQYIADLPVQREIHIGQFIFRLHAAGMKLDDIRKFFDEDALNIPSVKKDIERARFSQDEGLNAGASPRFTAWRAYVDKLSARYASQPLPAECEFIEDPGLPADQPTATLPLPGHPDYTVTLLASTPAVSLGIATASNRGLDPSLVTVSASLRGTPPPMACVFRSTLSSAQIWISYLQYNKIGMREGSARRKVLVAHYNGQVLPNCFQVTPLNCSQLGTVLVVGQGSVEQNNPSNVLEALARALNFGLPEDDARRVILINETGLPDQPAANQSAANVCLVHDFAFWSGKEANVMAFDWFRINFGITFQEEEREMKTLELQAAGRSAQ